MEYKCVWEVAVERRMQQQLWGGGGTLIAFMLSYPSVCAFQASCSGCLVGLL